MTAVSKSSGWLMVTIIPIFIRDLIRSLALMPMRLAELADADALGDPDDALDGLGDGDFGLAGFHHPLLALFLGPLVDRIKGAFPFFQDLVLFGLLFFFPGSAAGPSCRPFQIGTVAAGALFPPGRRLSPADGAAGASCTCFMRERSWSAAGVAAGTPPLLGAARRPAWPVRYAAWAAFPWSPRGSDGW